MHSDFIVRKYREQYSRHTVRDWSAYEQPYELRIRHAAAGLYSAVKSSSLILFSPDDHMGRPPKVTPEQKAVILLLK